MECTLCEMITENKDWNLEFLQLWVSEEVIQQIVGVPPPQPNLEVAGRDMEFEGSNLTTIIKVQGSTKDGLVRAEDAFAATGGILHDHNRRWIIRFTRYLGNCVVLNSELWGIKGGLKLTLDWRFERALIKTNSLKAINIIQDGDRENSNSAL
ncbi:hypothetical protein Goshw_002699, partial [Gossypium schwendimanii]|nr:hypothetical protein [Gossypium schwendimanii]